MDGRLFLSVTPGQGFWLVLISPYVLPKQYSCKIGVVLVENCQNSCWEPVVCVEAMDFKEMPFKTGL